MTTPRIVASECDSTHYPKNSFSGFAHCIDQGIDGIEFDVHLSKDGHVVVQHDYLLNKNITRDAAGNHLKRTGPALCDLTLKEIQTYDIGRYNTNSYEAKHYPHYKPVDGERIPTLDQFCAAVSGETTLWIELKTSPFQRDISSDPSKLLDAVLSIATKYGLEKQCVLLAFEWDLLVTAKQQCPDIQTDFLTINPEYIRATLKHQPDADPFQLYGEFSPAQFSGSYVDAIAAAKGDWWGPLITDVSKADIEQAQSLGIKTNLWNVESTSKGLEHALALHAEALTLSDPCLLKRRLKRG